ncbi:MAG: hypothetical protein KatS3mg105_0618 [Gemmatales bacterium]|nr:MAG: hypothetical protein KatS3mg105_0618 [Gemmatales bacterium]
MLVVSMLLTAGAFQVEACPKKLANTELEVVVQVLEWAAREDESVSYLATPPRDAAFVASLSMSVQKGKKFFARATIGDQELEVSGSVTQAGAEWLLEIEACLKTKSYRERARTSFLLRAGRGQSLGPRRSGKIVRAFWFQVHSK